MPGTSYLLFVDSLNASDLMDAKELRKKNRTELADLAKELSFRIRDLRFKVTTRQITKVRDLRQAKKDFARVQSVLRSLDADGAHL